MKDNYLSPVGPFSSIGKNEEKYCLQCGAKLLLNSVPVDPAYPHGPQTAGCSACGSRWYDMLPEAKIIPLGGIPCGQENTVLNDLQEKCLAIQNERDELLAGIKALYAGYVHTIASARQVLIESGYPCDSVEVMEKQNPALKSARDLIAKIEG